MIKLEFKDALDILTTFKELLMYAKKVPYVVADVPFYVFMYNDKDENIVTNFAYLYVEKESGKKIINHSKPANYLQATTKKQFDIIEKSSLFDLLAANKINEIRILQSMYSFGSIDKNWIALLNWSLLSADYKGVYKEKSQVSLTKINKAIALLKNHYENA